MFSCWMTTLSVAAKLTWFAGQLLALGILATFSLAIFYLSAVKFIQLKKLRFLKNVPHKREPLPYLNLLSLHKSTEQAGPEVSGYALFSAVVGFHRIYSKQGMHMFFIGTTPAVCLQKAQFFEEVLSSNSLLAKGPQYRLLHSWLGTGLLTSTGNKWRKRRRLFTPAFHFRILEDFLPNINTQSTILADKLGKMCRSGSFTDIVQLVTLCTLDIICETIMGTSIGAQFNEHSPYVMAVKSIGELFIKRTLNPLFASEFIFRRSSIGREYHKYLNTVHSLTRKVIAERKALLQDQGELDIERDSNTGNGKQSTHARTFLDLLLTEHFKNPSSITEEDIREEVDTFMFEGHDTTAMGISWALFLIGHHPNEQKQIHDELDAIFGNDKHRPVTSEDLRKMKHLERCLKEALRLYPAVSFITRVCEEPFQIGGTTFPKGTIVRLCAYCLHRDEAVFTRPEEFQPERFLPENVKRRHPYAYVPFSAGPRNCIGQKFALSEMKIVVANILRRFKLKSLDQRDQVTVVFELVLRPKNGLRIQFTER